MPNEATDSAIDEAIARWRARVIEQMVNQALTAHVEGERQAYATAGEPQPSKVNLQRNALIYSKQYRINLERDGATMINGKKNYWLKGRERQQRKEIAEIIDNAIASGEATGGTQSKAGTYPKNSVARRLQDYFKDQKSHASTVARTEVARIQNISRLNRYDEFGFTHVKVIDNEGPNSCAECRRKNGQTWTMKKAQQNELEHPNCVRTFIPIKNKRKEPKE